MVLLLNDIHVELLTLPSKEARNTSAWVRAWGTIWNWYRYCNNTLLSVEAELLIQYKGETESPLLVSLSKEDINVKWHLKLLCLTLTLYTEKITLKIVYFLSTLIYSLLHNKQNIYAHYSNGRISSSRLEIGYWVWISVYSC